MQYLFNRANQKKMKNPRKEYVNWNELELPGTSFVGRTTWSRIEPVTS